MEKENIKISSNLRLSDTLLTITKLPPAITTMIESKRKTVACDVFIILCMATK